MRAIWVLGAENCGHKIVIHNRATHLCCMYVFLSVIYSVVHLGTLGYFSSLWVTLEVLIGVCWGPSGVLKRYFECTLGLFGGILEIYYTPWYCRGIFG